MTALDIAVYSGIINLCKILLSNNEIKLNNCRAVIYAYDRHYLDILNLIIAHPKSANLSELFYKALKKILNY